MKHAIAGWLFLKQYWFWIACLFLMNGLVLVATEWSYPITLREQAGDLWSVRIYLASALLLFDNLCVLWWYAESTRRQTQVSEELLALSHKRYIEGNKPVVFIDRTEDSDRKGHATYVMRNVGGGYAVNVYCYDSTILTPVSLGSLASGQEQELPETVRNEFREGDLGLKRLLVAEGPYTRTTQWTPTLTLRSQTMGSHAGQVIHQQARVTAEPHRFQYQSLQEYVNENIDSLRAQFKALSEDG